MKTMFWLAVIASAAVAAFLFRLILRKNAERERASEARAAELLAQLAAARPATARPAPVAAVPQPNTLETQKLLFESARKAAEAGEPEIAVQLYDRLLARFPESRFAGEVRAASEAQKKKLSKA